MLEADVSANVVSDLLLSSVVLSCTRLCLYLKSKSVICEDNIEDFKGFSDDDKEFYLPHFYSRTKRSDLGDFGPVGMRVPFLPHENITCCCARPFSLHTHPLPHVDTLPSASIEHKP